MIYYRNDESFYLRRKGRYLLEMVKMLKIDSFFFVGYTPELDE